MNLIVVITVSTEKIHKRTYNQVTNYYDHSIEMSGGLPVLMPILQNISLAQELAARLDGLIISGGDEDINIVADTKLHKIFATDILTTNFFHNQAVKTIAPGFKASAYSEDGIIEAIESETAPFIVGVQAHPEALTDAYPHFIKLFEAFIVATKKTT